MPLLIKGTTAISTPQCTLTENLWQWLWVSGLMKRPHIALWISLMALMSVQEHSVLTDGAQVLEVGISEPNSCWRQQKLQRQWLCWRQCAHLVWCGKREKFLWCICINSDLLSNLDEWKETVWLIVLPFPQCCTFYTHTHNMCKQYFLIDPLLFPIIKNLLVMLS